jgi:hypothetical protein
MISDRGLLSSAKSNFIGSISIAETTVDGHYRAEKKFRIKSGLIENVMDKADYILMGCMASLCQSMGIRSENQLWKTIIGLAAGSWENAKKIESKTFLPVDVTGSTVFQ